LGRQEAKENGMSSEVKITVTGVAKSVLAVAAWYFYGFGAAVIAFLMWGQWSGKFAFLDRVLYSPKSDEGNTS